MSENKLVLGIIGSVNFKDEELFYEATTNFIIDYGMPTTVVTGGAKGADQMGLKWAKDHHLETVIFRPQWRKYETKDEAISNSNDQIATFCTHILAFPSREGKWTQDALQKAILRGKKIVKYFVD